MPEKVDEETAEELRKGFEIFDKHREIAKECEYTEPIPSIPSRPPKCEHPDGYGTCRARLCPKMDKWIKENADFQEVKEFRKRIEEAEEEDE